MLDLLYLGTTEFLSIHPDFVNEKEQESTLCNKDTGGLKTFHCWSRGIFLLSVLEAISSIGSHYTGCCKHISWVLILNIEYNIWHCASCRSESPTQAFLITILWLYGKFKHLNNAGYADDYIRGEMTSIVLACDNMCHLDGLLLSKKKFPFPKPFNEAWKCVGKVIDRLHLRNHVDPNAKKYITQMTRAQLLLPQTFIWASRFKRIMCAMPHLHQFFFLHRLVKYRNKYTEKCYKNH